MRRALIPGAVLILALGLGLAAFAADVRAQLERLVRGSTAPAMVVTDCGQTHETTRRAVNWDEAVGAVEFAVRRPSYLPTGIELSRIELIEVPGVGNEHQDRRVVLWYTDAEGEVFSLGKAPAFHEWPGSPPGSTAVMVNGAPGWAYTNENALLVWQTQEARYVRNNDLSLGEMLQIAESLR